MTLNEIAKIVNSSKPSFKNKDENSHWCALLDRKREGERENEREREREREKVTEKDDTISWQKKLPNLLWRKIKDL